MIDTDATAQPDNEAKSSVAARLLTAAVKAWLRSQLDSINELDLRISSGNRQLLSGTVPKIELNAHQVVYQGLHLQDLEVLAQQIRVNLRQILRGKAFQLLDPIPIDLNVILTSTGLQASLPSPLLQAAFQDLIQQLFGEQLPFPLDLSATQLELETETVRLTFPPLADTTDAVHPICLQTSVTVGQPYELVLSNPKWWLADPNINPPERHPLPNYCFNLGSQAHIQTLMLTAAGIKLGGQLQIMPETQSP